MRVAGSRAWGVAALGLVMMAVPHAIVLHAVQAADTDAATTAAALRHQALDHAYNLDRPEALALLEQAVRLEPDHPANHRLIATLMWLRILWDRGVVTVDDYLGALATKDVDLAQPAPRAELVQAYTEHVAKASTLAERRLARAPDDPQALYEVGAVYGLETSYHASVEGRMLKSFGLARKTYAAHARVLARDSTRFDSGYYVGSYRVVVSELSAPKRWIAYLAGMQGGKREGIALLEAAASHEGEAQGQARYTLVLIYNRDGRYADALRILDEVRRFYPRNRQFLYETAATWLRAGQPTQALTLLTDGIERLRTDTRPRWLGEEAVWHFKRGVALRQLGRWDEAKREFETALSLKPRPWIASRTQLELTHVAARDTSTIATSR